MAVEESTDQLSPLQKAVLLLKQSQAKLARYEAAQTEPIAVIGVGREWARFCSPDILSGARFCLPPWA